MVFTGSGLQTHCETVQLNKKESVRQNDSNITITQRYRMNTASVVLRVYQMGDGQSGDPRYILMTFTEMSTNE